MTKFNEPKPPLSEAMALHQQGRLEQAIAAYRTALQKAPAHIGTLNLLGIALIQMGKLQEAAKTIQQAIRSDPNQPSAHYNLGTVLQAMNLHEEALHSYEASLALKPDARTQNNIGATLKSLERVGEAEVAYRTAIALDPNYAEAYVNLAKVTFERRSYEETVSLGEKALTLNPKLPEAYAIIGSALNMLGRINEAVHAYDQAIRLNPTKLEPYVGAGYALADAGFSERAIPYLEEAARLQPESAATRFKLAACLKYIKRHREAEIEAEKGFALPLNGFEDESSITTYFQVSNRPEKAIIHAKRALSLSLDSSVAHLACAISLRDLGRTEEALAHLEECLRLAPDQIMAAYDKAMINLSFGKFEDAWKGYEHRFSDKISHSSANIYTAARWNGGHLAGKLIVWGEQGLGDQILHASIVRDALPFVKSMCLVVTPRLVELFTRSFPDVEVHSSDDEPGAIVADAQIPIASLGTFFRRSWSDFLRKPYLVANAERVSRLRNTTRRNNHCVIGISWRSGNPQFGDHKTAKLEEFVPLLKNPKMKFVNLQYGDTKDEISTQRAKMNLEIQCVDEIDNTNDIDGLAALIGACDAVVTVSNTTAHIAGAMGKPVWIMIPYAQGRFWYWFMDRRDSPWYPEARICRQQPGQSWADLVESITPEIMEFAAKLKAKD